MVYNGCSDNQVTLRDVSKMKISLEGLKAGWANVLVLYEGGAFDIHASDVYNDALLDLLNACIKIARGEPEAFVEFFMEPAAYLFVFRKDGERIAIEVRSSNRTEPQILIDPDYVRKFEHQTTIVTETDTLFDEVLDMFAHAKKKYASGMYEADWNYEFPEKRIEILKELRKYTREQRPDLYEKKRFPKEELQIEDILNGGFGAEIREFELLNQTMSLIAYLPNFGGITTDYRDDYDNITVRLSLRSEVFYVNLPKLPFSPVQFNICDLMYALERNNQWRYVPGASKKWYLDEISRGLALAYGRNADDYKFMFSIVSCKEREHFFDALILDPMFIEFEIT